MDRADILRPARGRTLSQMSVCERHCTTYEVFLYEVVSEVSTNSTLDNGLFTVENNSFTFIAFYKE
jgi:hypothetical protein